MLDLIVPKAGSDRHSAAGARKGGLTTEVTEVRRGKRGKGKSHAIGPWPTVRAAFPQSKILIVLIPLFSEERETLRPKSTLEEMSHGFYGCLGSVLIFFIRDICLLTFEFFSSREDFPNDVPCRADR